MHVITVDLLFLGNLPTNHPDLAGTVPISRVVNTGNTNRHPNVHLSHRLACLASQLHLYTIMFIPTCIDLIR